MHLAALIANRAAAMLPGAFRTEVIFMVKKAW